MSASPSSSRRKRQNASAADSDSSTRRTIAAGRRRRQIFRASSRSSTRATRNPCCFSSRTRFDDCAIDFADDDDVLADAGKRVGLFERPDVRLDDGRRRQSSRLGAEPRLEGFGIPPAPPRRDGNA